MFAVSLVFGIWLLVALFILGFGGTPVALLNRLFSGILVSVFAVVTRLGQRRFWGVALIGLYPVFAAFIFSYGGRSAALWNHLVAGVLLAGVGYTSAPKARPGASGSKARCHLLV